MSKSRKTKIRRNKKTKRRIKGAGGPPNNIKINVDKISTLFDVKGCTTYINKGNYGAVIRACHSTNSGCSLPCSSLKYVPLMQGENSPIEAKKSAEYLVHESTMMYMLSSHFNDQEFIYHFPQFKSAVFSINTSPWLATEFVNGKTIQSFLDENSDTTGISTFAPILYLQTMLILFNFNKILRGFVHGDLNPGNIFILRRNESHPKCKMEGQPGDESTNYQPFTYTFDEPYYVNIIDFGSAECYEYNYIDNPVAGKSIAGQWEIDAFMAACSFYDLANDVNKLLLQGFIKTFFGQELANAMVKKDFDIYQNRDMLGMHETKNDAEMRWFDFLNQLMVHLNISM